MARALIQLLGAPRKFRHVTDLRRESQLSFHKETHHDSHPRRSHRHLLIRRLWSVLPTGLHAAAPAIDDLSFLRNDEQSLALAAADDAAAILSVQLLGVLPE
jgi:hypothetical protein